MISTGLKGKVVESLHWGAGCISLEFDDGTAIRFEAESISMITGMSDSPFPHHQKIYDNDIEIKGGVGLAPLKLEGGSE